MCYMCPEAQLDDILVELQDHYGQVVSSDVLLPAFYQMSQEQNEKIQTFSSHPEGTLKQLFSHFPMLIPEGDRGQPIEELALLWDVQVSLRQHALFV